MRFFGCRFPPRKNTTSTATTTTTSTTTTRSCSNFQEGLRACLSYCVSCNATIRCLINSRVKFTPLLKTCPSLGSFADGRSCYFSCCHTRPYSCPFVFSGRRVGVVIGIGAFKGKIVLSFMHVPAEGSRSSSSGGGSGGGGKCGEVPEKVDGLRGVRGQVEKVSARAGLGQSAVRGQKGVLVRLHPPKVPLVPDELVAVQLVPVAHHFHHAPRHVGDVRRRHHVSAFGVAR
mmetsp:Transcript_67132/g.125461  ORF Transcript_67132/g.125461 Transcript_67132/m.125461 type:complete len:231 (+) Transcript_67132:465-1157(+)